MSKFAQQKGRLNFLLWRYKRYILKVSSDPTQNREKTPLPVLSSSLMITSSILHVFTPTMKQSNTTQSAFVVLISQSDEPQHVVLCLLWLQ